MNFTSFSELFSDYSTRFLDIFSQPETYTQIGLVLLIYVVAYILANRIRAHLPFFDASQQAIESHFIRKYVDKLSNLIFPLLAILMLRLSVEAVQTLIDQRWIVQTALTIAVLLLANSIIDDFVKNKIIVRVFKLIGIPLIFLHMIGVLDDLITTLESIQFAVGNIKITAYGILRVTIFGSLLFWMGKVSNLTGKEIIRRQEQLDYRTREVAAKLFEFSIVVVTCLLLLQVMGINLTALAVFGGALGVGLGFGLQAIASNFISGIIILLDRSVAIDDYVELEDGRTGVVRELNMRSTTLETFDGKDIMVPNEKFIVESFTNWTHKNKKQRYRVDFSVAYSSDVRKLVDIIKEVVGSHEQVLSGEEYPIEERPDCEIDSFGDSGINMFVEFWMMGIDDGKNRVGGDLLLMILEAIQEHGFEIPFPQREVRVLNNKFEINKVGDAEEF
ncbi:mechanosensitive ion channel [Aurantivibrio infirmus]